MIRIQLTLFSIVLVLLNCSTILGATLIVSGSGPGSFAIAGSGLNQVRGMDITLAYDRDALGSPVVSWGNLVSGAVNVANTGVPGSIRLAVVSNTPLSDSGQVAQITFSTSNGSDGISSITARLINASGTIIPVAATIAVSLQNSETVQGTSGNISSPPSTDSQHQNSTSPTATTPTILGVVSMPIDSPPNRKIKPTDPPANVQPPGMSVAPDDTATRHQEVFEKKPEITEKIAEQKLVIYGSALERFKTYQGDRTPENMKTLFSKPLAQELRQEPAIAVSDGISAVTLFVSRPKNAGSSPSFSLSDVKLISLEREDDMGALILKVLPTKNSINASVTILTDQTIATCPLTLIPPPAEVATKEVNFAAFLKDTGAKPPKFDLNRDGVHDYLDDYIYTGQYLIKMKEETGTGKK